MGLGIQTPYEHYFRAFLGVVLYLLARATNPGK
jgi:hypothetical protein